MPLFTVFTGTYNSGNIIHRVFQSIENQQFRDFEWIVIDDCSSDNTVNVIQDFIARHPELEIKLIAHTVNTGVAFSRKEALELAKGRYFVTWDHDDEQLPEQLRVFAEIWAKTADHQVGNIQAKVKDQHGKTLGIPFPEQNWISDYITAHNQYLTGSLEKGNAVEHHVCVKTTLFLETINYFLANNHLLGGNFPSGGDIWAMMAYKGHKTVFINQVVRKYYVAEAGRSSMSSGNRNRKAARVYYHKLLWVNYFNRQMPSGEIKWKLRMVFATLMYGFLAGKTAANMLAEIRQPGYRVLALPMILPAYLLARKYGGNN